MRGNPSRSGTTERAFPINHRIWIPLKVNPASFVRLKGPDVLVFGRLAPGSTLETAQSELTTVGQQTAAAFPSTHEKIRPRVLPYTYPFFDIRDAETGRLYRSVKYLMSLLLLVVCVNVSILVYARTATRQGEIAVRSALGASRKRVVAQLFIEALVQRRLQSLSGGGGSGMQMGRMWTALIVGQVGVAVALLPAAVFATWSAFQIGTADLGFAAHEFVPMQLRVDRGTATTGAADVTDREFALRYSERQAEITRRLEVEPGVATLTYGLAMPGEEMTVFLEADGVPMPDRPADYSLREGTALGHLVRFTRVDVNFSTRSAVPVAAGPATSLSTKLRADSPRPRCITRRLPARSTP